MEKKSKEYTIDMIISFIETYQERQVVYDELNNKIKNIQGDFYANIDLIDHILCNKLFDFIDHIIYSMTGCEDIICHILYDTAQIEIDGTMYNLKNKDELKTFLNLKN